MSGSVSAPDGNNLPWFAPGLSFTCTQCGNCCTGSPGYVWVTPDEIEAIARHLDKPIGEIRLLHTRPARGLTSLVDYANGDCTFFDPRTRHCRIYEVRPVQCRTWPFWRSNIASAAAWSQTQATCPGAGHGDFIPLERVQELASRIEL
ncbi:MAG: YkgJ family cysteine cluster protein [Planctomycetaceae bacterium]